MSALLYIHGKFGSAKEAEHYKPLFPDYEIIGLDYRTFTPWDTGREIHTAVLNIAKQHKTIVLTANSIGAYFALHANIDTYVTKAYFISPIVDMEHLILRMMSQSNTTEDELRQKGIIHTTFGEDLSWEYLSYIREHKISWNVSTDILYGSEDNIVSIDNIEAFVKAHNANLTVMNDGEHWFHTKEQMEFLDKWICGDTPYALTHTRN